MRSRLAQRDRNGCGCQKCLLEFDCGGDSCKKVAKAGTPRGGGGLPLDAEEGRWERGVSWTTGSWLALTEDTNLSLVPASIRFTTSRRSSSSTMLYRSKTALERCPDILITTDSGTPRRRALVTKLRLRSWNQTPVSFAASHARRNTLRMSFHASSVSGLVNTQSLLMCRGWASSASL